MNVESLDLPTVHAAAPLAITGHSDIEAALAVLKEGRPALVSIENRGKLREWAEMADTLVGMVRASGHHIALVSDSMPVGSRRWRKSTRSLARLRAFLIFPSKLADPSMRLSYKSDGNAEYLEVISAQTTVLRRTRE